MAATAAGSRGKCCGGSWQQPWPAGIAGSCWQQQQQQGQGCQGSWPPGSSCGINGWLGCLSWRSLLIPPHLNDASPLSLFPSSSPPAPSVSLLQIDKNKALVEALSSYLPSRRAELTPSVASGLRRRSGYSSVEVFRKYLWYLLRERSFDPDAVADMVALKRCLGLSDEEVGLGGRGWEGDVLGGGAVGKGGKRGRRQWE